MTKITKHQLRTELLKTNDKVIIRSNGEVHCYGVMPYTNRTGWYLKGFEENLRDMMEAEQSIKNENYTA